MSNKKTKLRATKAMMDVIEEILLPMISVEISWGYFDFPRSDEEYRIAKMIREAIIRAVSRLRQEMEKREKESLKGK